MCIDSKCSSLSKDSSIFLNNNPSTLNLKGHLDSKITIKRDQAMNKMIYLEASNPFAKTQPMKNTVQGLFIVCGLEKIVAKDPSNNVFDIKGIKSNSSNLTFPLEGIWEVDSSELLQAPSDCPISKYFLCDDALCTNETKESWLSLEDKTV